MYKFDAITEGITALEAIIIRNGQSLLGFNAVTAEKLPYFSQITDLISHMGFCFCPIKPIFSSDVHLKVRQLHPETASSFEVLGLWYFAESEKLTVKRFCFVFRPSWDGDLSMMNPDNHKISLFGLSGILRALRLKKLPNLFWILLQ